MNNKKLLYLVLFSATLIGCSKSSSKSDIKVGSSEKSIQSTSDVQTSENNTESIPETETPSQSQEEISPYSSETECDEEFLRMQSLNAIDYFSSNWKMDVYNYVRGYVQSVKEWEINNNYDRLKKKGENVYGYSDLIGYEKYPQLLVSAYLDLEIPQDADYGDERIYKAYFYEAFLSEDNVFTLLSEEEKKAVVEKAGDNMKNEEYKQMIIYIHPTDASVFVAHSIENKLVDQKSDVFDYLKANNPEIIKKYNGHVVPSDDGRQEYVFDVS